MVNSLQLTVDSKRKLKDLEKEFDISTAGMKRVMKDFQIEMEKALAGQKSSLKMFQTYARRPTGNEKGFFLALDLGGTNFRVLKLRLRGGRKLRVSKVKAFALKKSHIRGPGEKLFDFLAKSIKDFLKSAKSSNDGILNLGFTFSFPVKQTNLASGRLVCWTKGFDAQGVVGKDVVKLLEEALADNSINNIRVAALANDTVGTLMAASYKDPDCDIGVIIGTGTNACYVEESGMIVNIEWGNFNKLKTTAYDRRIDKESDNPGEQILEKMVSGMYLGEISRLALIGLLKRKELEKINFKTEYMSIIEADSSAGLSSTGRLLKRLGILSSSLKERRMVKKACSLVSRRASRIIAASLASILMKMDPELLRRHTIAIDGSLYEKHPDFQKSMRSAIKEIFGSRAAKVRMMMAKDASGIGAGVTAAVGRLVLTITLAGILLAGTSYSFAANPTVSDEMGARARTEELQKEEEALRAQIEKEKKTPEIEEKLPQAEIPAAGATKTRIAKINVTGATLLPEKIIREVVSPFEDKELTLAQMQDVADLITNAYRRKRYVTSRAYLPPQRIEDGTLEIRIIEGRMGSLDVKGNYHYKTHLFKKKFSLKKNEPFNYNLLTDALRRINEHPDRTARAVLMPGKEPGTTDVVLQVKDTLPIHTGFNFDNFLSRYLFRNSYQFNAADNNLFGFEDILNIRYTMAEGRSYESLSANYILPATDTLKIGLSGATSMLHLIKDAKDLDVHGKSRLFSVFATQSVVDHENASFDVNLEYDHKDIFNYQLNNETSRDKTRVVKAGVNLDITDPIGRTVFAGKAGFGIPDFLGGLEAKDPRSSRVGSGGEFSKYTMNIYRLQRMPFSSTILWSTQFQFSNKPLTSTEEFQLGGVVNVRAYPPAELVGDEGYATSVEWSFPPYLVPRNLKIPFTSTNLYDALRMIAFYDYGNIYLRKPLSTEKKRDQLSGAGWGVRFNFMKNMSLRADFAWALDRKPSDGNNQHSWIQISARF